MNIFTRIEKKLFPDYSKWELFKIISRTNNGIVYIYSIEVKENLQTGKKISNTTLLFEIEEEQVTSTLLEEVKKELLRLENSKFRKEWQQEIVKVT